MKTPGRSCLGLAFPSRPPICTDPLIMTAGIARPLVRLARPDDEPFLLEMLFYALHTHDEPGEAAGGYPRPAEPRAVRGGVWSGGRPRVSLRRGRAVRRGRPGCAYSPVQQQSRLWMGGRRDTRARDCGHARRGGSGRRLGSPSPLSSPALAPRTRRHQVRIRQPRSSPLRPIRLRFLALPPRRTAWEGRPRRWCSVFASRRTPSTLPPPPPTVA